MTKELHFCDKVEIFPVEKFLQFGQGKGQKLLIIGESPALNGWIKSGKAFYTVDNKLLPSGRNLNKLLSPFSLTVEQCGFTELVKCCVGKNRKSLVKCAPKWKKILLKQIELCCPRLIIILGVETLRIFNLMFNTSLVTGELGKFGLGKAIVNILPIYHPSPIAPKNHHKNLEIIELQKKSIQKLLD